MSTPTHITQINGESRGPFVDYIRTYPDQLRASLKGMNGSTFWAYSLWRAPEGADLLEDIPFNDEYMQCAGTAEGLTIEFRRLGSDGTAHQYTIGKPGGGRAGEPTEVIHWDEGRHSTAVYPHEVFTADEAAVVFYTYFLTNEVSQPYELRELHLNRPKPQSDAGAS